MPSSQYSRLAEDSPFSHTRRVAVVPTLRQEGVRQNATVKI
ncbi:hypothetical protein Lser_V15G23973 [Lactuca serriola]